MLNKKQKQSRISQISDLRDWDQIRHTLDEMYDNKSEKGGGGVQTMMLL